MSFITDRQLKALIAAYFKYIKGEYHLEDTPAKGKGGDEMVKQKIWDREPEAPTISGLAHYLGFDSRDAFNQYELTGEFASTLKRSRLRIEAEYEKKLHQQPSSGAIFALKTWGGMSVSAQLQTNNRRYANCISRLLKVLFRRPRLRRKYLFSRKGKSSKL
jgi:hypothetical protein